MGGTHNPGSKESLRYCVRLTPDIKAFIEHRAAELRITPSEVVREALTLYFYGQQGPADGYRDGFQQARRLAVSIALGVLADAYAQIPADPTDAIRWSQDRLRLARKRMKGDVDLFQQMYPDLHERFNGTLDDDSDDEE